MARLGTPECVASRWDLAPNYDAIRNALGTLSPGEAAFLVAMYGFYNASTAKEMMEQLHIGGLADVASRLDAPQREVVAQLLISYEGW